jgi:hypothetical protein
LPSIVLLAWHDSGSNYEKGVPTTIATHVQTLDFGAHLRGFTLPWTNREAAVRETTPAERMPEFERRFDELVDLLCWSAKEGDHEGRDEQYASLRAWFLDNYEPMRPYLLEYLTVEPEDLVPVRPGMPAPRDAFESLFLPRDIDSLIHSDTVIFRIIRTRQAVDALRDALDARYPL